MFSFPEDLISPSFISCKAALMVLNDLSFCFYKKSLMSFNFEGWLIWMLISRLAIVLYIYVYHSELSQNFKMYLFKLEDNYFTILWWFLPYMDINQPQVYMFIPHSEPPSTSFLHLFGNNNYRKLFTVLNLEEIPFWI